MIEDLTVECDKVPELVSVEEVAVINNMITDPENLKDREK